MYKRYFLFIINVFMILLSQYAFAIAANQSEIKTVKGMDALQNEFYILAANEPALKHAKPRSIEHLIAQLDKSLEHATSIHNQQMRNIVIKKVASKNHSDKLKVSSTVNEQKTISKLNIAFHHMSVDKHLHHDIHHVAAMKKNDDQKNNIRIVHLNKQKQII